MPFTTTRLRGRAIDPDVVHPMAFPPCEARSVLRRLEFHHVSKHASWLNMVEIEIGVLRSQRLDRRIAVKRSSLFGK